MLDLKQPEIYEAAWFKPEGYVNGAALLPSIENTYLDKFIKGDVSQYKVLSVISVPFEAMYSMTHIYLLKKGDGYLYCVFESSKETGSVARVITPIVLDRIFKYESSSTIEEAKDYFNSSTKTRIYKV